MNNTNLINNCRSEVRFGKIAAIITNRLYKVSIVVQYLFK
jgi:hypothetical protein